MYNRATDHKSINLAELHRDVVFGKTNKIIWQPRIGCWITDRLFKNGDLPEPYSGMSEPELYRSLGCSARIYEYNACFKLIEASRVHTYSRDLNELETEYIIECPVGKLTSIMKKNSSNYGIMPSKWRITCEDDMKVAIWLEENRTWEWDQEAFDSTKNKWGDLGAPTIYMPRTNIQHLYIDEMGVEEATYALYDYTDTVEAYFRVLDERNERLINVINKSPIDIINFGDNLHCGTLPASLFKKYVLPAYQRRTELLHTANKFVYSHWDGDTRFLLPYAKETGLDGIEAITPKPQGDVTIEEIKKALGDDLFLIDGIAAILFDEHYPLEDLENQTKQIIEAFAPKLVFGISDEISSTGDIERVRLVGKIVDDYNAKL